VRLGPLRGKNSEHQMTPNSVMNSVVLIIYIHEVCGSDISLETIYPEWLSSVLSVLLLWDESSFQMNHPTR
jgi:hypothetical protein